MGRVCRCVIVVAIMMLIVEYGRQELEADSETVEGKRLPVSGPYWQGRLSIFCH